MNFDGFVTGAVVCELQKALIGGRIEKIYQPEADELVFHIHSGANKHRLYLSASGGHARLHLLKEKEQGNPQTPFAFCMLLRKHLQGGRIAGIRQVESERIVQIDVNHPDEMGYSVDKRLVVEIMGKHSNISAVDLSTGRILDSIRRVGIDVNRYRQLLPGLPYMPPPSQGKESFYELTEASLAALLSIRTGDPAKALLSGIQGVGPLVSEEIVERAVLASAGEEVSAVDLYPVLKEMVSSIQSEIASPVVYLDAGNSPIAYHMFPLALYRSQGTPLSFQSPSEAVEYFYSHRTATNRTRQKATDLHRTVDAALDKLYLKKQRLSEDMIAAEDGESFRIFGELLTANLHQLSSGETFVEVNDYYTDLPVAIPLDPRLTPAQNAQKYYRKYSKMKTAKIEKRIQIAETDIAIEYLESVTTFLNQAETPEEIDAIRDELTEGGYLRRRKPGSRLPASRLKPQTFVSGDGFRILVGRNNKENDQLTFKTADKRDLWLHVKDIPGSHVILVVEGKPPTETAILEAAAIAAYYSKARLSANVPVDYTKVRYVKKPSGAKPGMVIFTDNRTVFVHPHSGTPL
jgi:predicted ribosome quality control (RQC) complex YloA/Tae2 family protein